MSTISQRPGVYSSYTVSSLYAPSRNARGAAVIAASGTAGSQGVEITTLAQLEGAFSQEDGALYTAVRLLLASGVPKVFCIGLGQNPDAQQYTAALELLKSRKDCYGILCDSALAAVHTAFAGYLEEGAQSQREQLAFFGIGEGEDALTAAQSANQERMIFTAGSAGAFGLEKSPLVPAAAVAAAVLTCEDVSLSFCYRELPLLEGLSPVFTEEEIDELLLGGVTVLEESAGQAQIIKCVTSRTATDGQTDRSFAAVNTILVIDEVMAALRSRLTALLKGGRNNAATRESIASQAVVCLAGFVEEGKLDSYEKPLCSQSEEDPSVCVVQVAFRIAHVIHQIVVDAKIQI